MSETPRDGDGSVCTARTGSSGTLGEAKDLYEARCASVPRADCDPVPGGGWVCSSGAIGTVAPTRVPATPSPAPTEPPPVAPTPALAPEPGPDPAPLPTGGSDVGRVLDGDLLVLHYDNCPDRDDGHAMAAGYTLTAQLGLDPLVVNGTCGESIKNRYQPSSSAVVQASFGSALNALSDPANALARSVEAWAAVLASSCGHVWVAEGGPSDFTARVLQVLARDYPGLDLERVHVVQHSDWNENQTGTQNLRLVREVTDYVRLADGNRANATADLNRQSTAFVAAARESRFAGAWNAAFDYLNPDERLDFSDTVELLYIIDDDTLENPEDFAARYLR